MESKLKQEDKDLVKKFDQLTKDVNTCLGKYRFSDAAEVIYHFMWDRLAAEYLESAKGREDKNVALATLRHLLANCLKLLHPFMPFVTEALWEYIPATHNKPLATTQWPTL